MRASLAISAVVFSLASSAAFAQEPDCRIVLSAAGTAEHVGEIVLPPSTTVTLAVRCTGTAVNTYSWAFGASTASIVSNAPATAGGQQAYEVTVSANAQSRVFSAIVRAAAAGAPTCTLTRDPAGTVPVFTNVRVTANCPGATSYSWAGGHDLRGQGTASVLHVNVVNDPAALAVTIDVTAGNASGQGAATAISIGYSLAPPSCRIVTTPSGTIAPLAPVTLTAECDGAPTGYQWSNGSTGSSFTVNLASSTGYSVVASNAAGAGMVADVVIGVSGEAPVLRNYTGHWWGGAFENGWGMTLNQHEERIFGVIYFYDATGEPTWVVMPAGTWNANFTAYTGALYAPTGTPYTNYDASQLLVQGEVGMLTLTFTSPTAATASYRLGYSQFDAAGRSMTTYGQKTLEPLIFNSGANPSGLNVADMWWGGAAQNGWGISINQRSSELFSAWFTYGADGRPTWFIASSTTWNGNTSPVSIFHVTGSPWLGVPYDPSRVDAGIVGQGSYAFTNATQGTFNYTIGGVSGVKPIEVQGF